MINLIKPLSQRQFRVFRDEFDNQSFCVREVDFDENPTSGSLYSGTFEEAVDFFNRLVYPDGAPDDIVSDDVDEFDSENAW